MLWNGNVVISDGYGVGMLNRIGRYWRILATGFSFTIFGIGGVFLRILIFPILNMLIWEHELRIALARQVIRSSFVFFIGVMRTLGVLSFTISGLERLERKGLLIIANHPTLLDTVFLMSLVKRADCVVKSELWNNPFTRGPVRSAGYINNTSSANLIKDCITSLRKGSNLIIFPEGTRTPADGAITLKRGAANIAVRGARNITPITIRCTPSTLGKGDKWWQVPSRLMHFSIQIGEDIDIHPFIAESSNEVLAVRHLTNYLQDYFNKENKRHAFA